MIRLDTHRRLTALAVLLAVAPLFAPVAAAGTGSATTADRHVEVTRPGDVVESTNTSTSDCQVPTSLTFGEVPVGETVTGTVTVPGLEDGDLTVTASLIGTAADQFRIIDGGGTFTIPDGESHDITVAYTPTEAGTANAQIELVPDDDSLDRRCIDLQGEGVDDSGGGAPIDVSLSTTALEFGEIPVGTTDQRTVTVTNDGSDPVVVAPGDPSGPFTVAPREPIEVAPGESHEISVAFAPDSEGTAFGSLQIAASNDTDTVERVVELSGTGAANGSEIDVSLSTETVDFGVVDVDDVGRRTVTVTNEGNATVRIGAGITDGTFSVVDGTTPRDLAPGETREFVVEFPPRSGGPENGSMLILVQNGTDSVERTVALTGVGADPQIAVSVADDRLTVDDPQTTVTVANDGEGPLIVDEFTLPGPFTADVETPLRVPAGEQRQVAVTFDTDADTNVTSTLRIGSNDADTPVVRRTIRGVVEGANATVAVDGRTSDDERTVNATVTDVEPGSTVGIDTGTGVNRSENVSVDEVAVTVEDGDPFSLNVTQSDDELDTSPTFNLSTGTEDVGYLRINHTVPDADIESVTFTFTVPDERIPRNESTGELDPDDMSLYRFVDGEWVELETEPVRRLDGAWEFRAASPGLSEFAIGRKEPQFEIDSAEINVSSARVGDSVAVRVLITNTGGADGLYDVQLFENDELVDRRRPTVPPNGTVRIVFLRSYEEAGDYRIDVNNRTIDTLSVEPEGTETPNNTTTDPGPTSTEPRPTTPIEGGPGPEPDDDGLPIVPLLAVGLAVTAGAGIVYRRMNGGDDGPPADDATDGPPGGPGSPAGSAPGGAVELSGDDDEWDEWDDWENDDGDGGGPPDGDAAGGADDAATVDDPDGETSPDTAASADGETADDDAATDDEPVTANGGETTDAATDDDTADG